MSSRTGQLARLGFADAARADQLLDDRRWPGWSTRFDDLFGDGVVDALGAVADPDLALLGLVRLDRRRCAVWTTTRQRQRA